MDDHSQLCIILKSDDFKDDEDPSLISIHTLLMWGLLLCPGDKAMKTRVLYDVLQDNLQTFISAIDKDFLRNFDKLIVLATIVPYKYVYSFGIDIKYTHETVNQDLIEEIRDKFLDDIFDTKAKLYRNDYLKLVQLKASWIYNSTEIRRRVSKMITEKK